MRTNRARVWTYGLAASAALAAGVAAAPAKDEPKPAGQQQQQPDMAEWVKMNQPGPEHKQLAAHAGQWAATVTAYGPDGAGMESKGKETCTVVLGGRFLASVFEGDMMGMAFTGHGLTGYDAAKRKFVMTWADSMSTGIMCFEGTLDETRKTMTLHAEQKGPDGKLEKWRSVETVVDPDTRLFEMHSTPAGGPERKAMSIKYTRVKK